METIETTTIPAAEFYMAMQIVLCLRLRELCAGGTRYLDWTEKHFPPVYRCRMESFPSWIKRSAERAVPSEPFAAQVDCVVNAHRQAWPLWRLAQSGMPVVAWKPSPGGFEQ